MFNQFSLLRLVEDIQTNRESTPEVAEFVTEFKDATSGFPVLQKMIDVSSYAAARKSIVKLATKLASDEDIYGTLYDSNSYDYFKKSVDKYEDGDLIDLSEPLQKEDIYDLDIVKGQQVGRTYSEDISDAIAEYKAMFSIGKASPAEILTLARFEPNNTMYQKAASQITEDPIVVGGPASVEMVDREGHLITAAALQKGFANYMANPRARNIMVLHSDVQVGWALPAYISKSGQVFKSGVDDKHMFLISELRNDTSIAKRVSEQVLKGKLASYSIAGSALDQEQIMKSDGTSIKKVNEIELAETTICEKGVNQGAHFDILKSHDHVHGKSCADGSCLIDIEKSEDDCGCDGASPELDAAIAKLSALSGGPMLQKSDLPRRIAFEAARKLVGGGDDEYTDRVNKTEVSVSTGSSASAPAAITDPGDAFRGVNADEGGSPEAEFDDNSNFKAEHGDLGGGSEMDSSDPLNLWMEKDTPIYDYERYDGDGQNIDGDFNSTVDASNPAEAEHHAYTAPNDYGEHPYADHVNIAERGSNQGNLETAPYAPPQGGMSYGNYWAPNPVQQTAAAQHAQQTGQAYQTSFDQMPQPVNQQGQMSQMKMFLDLMKGDYLSDILDEGAEARQKEHARHTEEDFGEPKQADAEKFQDEQPELEEIDYPNDKGLMEVNKPTDASKTTTLDWTKDSDKSALKAFLDLYKAPNDPGQIDYDPRYEQSPYGEMLSPADDTDYPQQSYLDDANAAYDAAWDQPSPEHTHQAQFEGNDAPYNMTLPGHVTVPDPSNKPYQQPRYNHYYAQNPEQAAQAFSSHPDFAQHNITPLGGNASNTPGTPMKSPSQPQA